MTLREKILAAGIGTLLCIVAIGAMNAPKIANALQLYNQQDQYTYFATNTNTTTAATMIQYTAGTLHAVVITNPAASSVITLYDTANGIITAPTVATATIWVGPIAGATSTATGTLAFSLNGQTVTTASVSNGSSTTDAATAITTAITASSTLLGVTATSTTNVVIITAKVIGPIGNVNLPVIAAQNGFTFYNGLNNSQGTPIITQITLPTTTTYLDVPIEGTYDVAYKYGLGIQQTNGTSSVTVAWQQQ